MGGEPVLPRTDPDLERSRESAAQLLDAFARRLRTNRTVRGAASGFQRAASYVQTHSWGEMAAEVDSFVRRRPGAAISIAVVAGFVVGRVLRPR